MSTVPLKVRRWRPLDTPELVKEKVQCYDEANPVLGFRYDLILLGLASAHDQKAHFLVFFQYFVPWGGGDIMTL